MSENIYLNVYLEDIKNILSKSLSVQLENNQLLKEQNKLLEQISQYTKETSIRLKYIR